MSCLVPTLGFAFGFALTFWLFPILAGWLDAPLPWWGHWLVALVGGILVAGAAYSALEKSREEARRSEEDEIIRRAQVKQAEEYLASKDDDSSQDSETDDGKPLY